MYIQYLPGLLLVFIIYHLSLMQLGDFVSAHCRSDDMFVVPVRSVCVGIRERGVFQLSCGILWRGGRRVCLMCGGHLFSHSCGRSVRRVSSGHPGRHQRIAVVHAVRSRILLGRRRSVSGAKGGIFHYSYHAIRMQACPAGSYAASSQSSSCLLCSNGTSNGQVPFSPLYFDPVS